MRTQILQRQTRALAATAIRHVAPPATARLRPALRPPLKWAGGKRWQVPHLIPLWRAHAPRRLVEPFCGGLAVTLSLMPDQALLNDINQHVINFYRWLGRGLTINLPMKNSERLFYRHRRRFNQLLADGSEVSSEAASLFYYLNRTGYNGLCRFNQQGSFNVPFGRYVRINYATDFLPYRENFSGWEFTTRDFEEIDLDRGDFVYADPPYDVEFTQYAKTGFSWEDQVRAAEWLSRHRGPVVLSNQATPRIVRLYQKLGFTLRFLSAPRMISCTGDRSPAREVLALKNV
ncbi:Dam family site-specific DNA-(adenine-N6)-methyltransferase [Candidatus Berkelbacteria bacterium]|nr:Dam family site-specific DNA-(adenine-N6)-methyltransferase [Candidatus Berkelbacteria bacterium]